MDVTQQHIDTWAMWRCVSFILHVGINVCIKPSCSSSTSTIQTILLVVAYFTVFNFMTATGYWTIKV